MDKKIRGQKKDQKAGDKLKRVKTGNYENARFRDVEFSLSQLISSKRTSRGSFGCEEYRDAQIADQPISALYGSDRYELI